MPLLELKLAHSLHGVLRRSSQFSCGHSSVTPSSGQIHVLGRSLRNLAAQVELLGEVWRQQTTITTTTTTKAGIKKGQNADRVNGQGRKKKGGREGGGVECGNCTKFPNKRKPGRKE